MKKYIIISIIAVVVVGGAFAINYLKSISDYKQKVNNIVIDDIKINNKEDGKYIGEFDANVISAKVEVEVKNKKIININLLEHKNERGTPAEVIPQNVVDAQSLKVDVISGATNSSKVILKAIENALSKDKVWVSVKVYNNLNGHWIHSSVI